jgi:hypothetical protein
LEGMAADPTSGKLAIVQSGNFKEKDPPTKCEIVVATEGDEEADATHQAPSHVASPKVGETVELSGRKNSKAQTAASKRSRGNGSDW